MVDLSSVFSTSPMKNSCSAIYQRSKVKLQVADQYMVRRYGTDITAQANRMNIILVREQLIY